MSEGIPEITPDWRRRRHLAAELYRPETVRLIIMGEAPPPERFFYFGDSLFFRYLARAFAPLAGEDAVSDAGQFLALYKALGGWRTDVCDAPRRATKGGADDVSDCLEAFVLKWRAMPFSEEPLVIVSPKRLLLPALPPEILEKVTGSVPPPGQWNAHRQAFLRDMGYLLEDFIGNEVIQQAAAQIDEDDARLDFEIARACAEGADQIVIERLLRGHPHEARLSGRMERRVRHLVLPVTQERNYGNDNYGGDQLPPRLSEDCGCRNSIRYPFWSTMNRAFSLVFPVCSHDAATTSNRSPYPLRMMRMFRA